MPSATAIKRRPLGLHVGGNARIRLGDDVDGAQRPTRASRSTRDRRPRRSRAPPALELRQHRVEMLRHDAGDRGRAAGDGGGDQQRGGLDAVGNSRCVAPPS